MTKNVDYDRISDQPLTDAEIEQFKPIEQVMPEPFLNMVFAHQEAREQQGLMKPRGRGKQKAPTKQSVTIRLSREVVEAFKATGKGWQSRINEALLQHIHSA